jgi:predicted 3-demethylubiquinone-9 3-methyltransferase (glyoxalase superfamily)/uncharacterized protein YndB with AHSA1/START domain
MTPPSHVRTCLWFDHGGLAAARFYASLLPNSVVETDAEGGSEPMVVAFSLAGVPYQILNGGPVYRASPAASIVVTTPDQAETDRLWAALTADGGEPGRCGWLTDRWGVSWQIVPETLPRLLGAPDREAAGRAQVAMLQMHKLEIAALEAAFYGGDGRPSAAAPLIVEAWVPASPRQAWSAFTTAAAITQWNQASPDWHCPSATVDLRVGGKHVARMEARDGSFGFDFEGVYEEIEPARALTLRMDDGRRARTTFVAEGAGTRVTTSFDPEASNPEEMQRAGWQAILDSYAAYVATLVEANTAE